MEINQNSIIDVGFPLSKNFVLDHFTNGAFHPIMGEWIPRFSSILKPSQPNNIFSNAYPLWKIAKNLQTGAQNVVENLLSEIGGDLVIRSAFLNNIPSTGISEADHLLGKSFDIAIKGYEENMYNVAGEIQKIARNASDMTLMYGNSSWMHINIDPKKALDASYKVDLPVINTRDILADVTETGISSLRGFF